MSAQAPEGQSVDELAAWLVEHEQMDPDTARFAASIHLGQSTGDVIEVDEDGEPLKA